MLLLTTLICMWLCYVTINATVRTVLILTLNRVLSFRIDCE